MGSSHIVKFTPPSLLPSFEDTSSRTSVCRITDRIPTYVKELIAGGVAGGFAKTVVAPLERTKILYQTQNATFGSFGLLHSLGFIYQKEGALGFYKGNGASVIRVVPYAALHFTAYEQYRRLMIDYFPIGDAPGASVDLLAGALAGGTAVLCTYPLDFARTMLAFQVKDAVTGSVPFKGFRDVFSKVVKESGFKGMYRGIAPTLYGMLPYAGLKFYVYERMKSSLPDEQQSSVFVKLACGAVAGVTGQTVTYPLDVVRRQMQVQAVGPSNEGYTSTFNGLVSIARKQGVQQLFAGLSINYIKLVPSVAIGFTTYDAVKSWLRAPPRDRGGKKLNT
ncbi:hypothetical protein GOP47_0029455 [Adiantum capillus-veneris]|nr:hypothetical protein GOP47_0029455 [Adiantum capillus-veneris]